MPSSASIIIGSRGSDLALWQSNHIKSELERLYPDLTVSIEIIKTTGDKIVDSPLSVIGGKGAFTAELEEALLRNEIDIAVHSLKDLPTEIHGDLIIAAIPQREDVRDAFIGKGTKSLADLPVNASVATGSLRRKAQLLALRPDLTIVDIRGNVPTRVRKLKESNWDGMLLASAGLRRLSMDSEISEYIDPESILPAPGQGALAVQCRLNDSRVKELLLPLDDADARACVTAERIVLNALGGGCQVPLGTYAKKNGEVIQLTASIVSLDGSSTVKHSLECSVNDVNTAAQNLAQTLLDNGGKDILNTIL
ncbi:MAG TPA: hydroxymethylbilane synthase [Candidatus Kapabacteria bacterium]|nr:hydroxymethylbilane synthase [Candidatus Kapabacteria bacterium]